MKDRWRTKQRGYMKWYDATIFQLIYFFQTEGIYEMIWCHDISADLFFSNRGDIWNDMMPRYFSWFIFFKQRGYLKRYDATIFQLIYFFKLTCRWRMQWRWCRAGTRSSGWSWRNSWSSTRLASVAARNCWAASTGILYRREWGAGTHVCSEK